MTPYPQTLTVLPRYCRQKLTPEFDTQVSEFLSMLFGFQERQRAKEPLKVTVAVLPGESHVLAGQDSATSCHGYEGGQQELGPREGQVSDRGTQHRAYRGRRSVAAGHLSKSDVSVVGGLDDTLKSILDRSKELELPVFFALSRRKLGRALGKPVPVSIVAVLNCDGAFPQFKVHLYALARDLTSTAAIEDNMR